MRIASIVTLAAAVLAVGAASLSARADDEPSPAVAAQYAQRLVAGKIPDKGKAYACFARRYGAAHLAKHPGQRVTAMKLLVSAEKDKTEGSTGVNYAVQLALQFRDRPGAYNFPGYCGNPTASAVSADKLQLICGGDGCDSGSITVEMANADKSAIIRLQRISLWQSKAHDVPEFDASDDPDDQVFRLDRVRLDECKSLKDDTARDKPATM